MQSAGKELREARLSEKRATEQVGAGAAEAKELGAEVEGLRAQLAANDAPPSTRSLSALAASAEDASGRLEAAVNELRAELQVYPGKLIPPEPADEFQASLFLVL
jgi:hypothetical protein